MREINNVNEHERRSLQDIYLTINFVAIHTHTEKAQYQPTACIPNVCASYIPTTA